MTNLIKTKSGYRSVIFAIISTFCICGSLFLVTPGNWVPIALFAAAPLMLWLLITHTTNLVYVLFFLIPVSIPGKFIEGSVIGFPSEALAVLILFFLWMRNAAQNRNKTEVFRHPLVMLLLIEIGWMFFCAVTSEDPLVGLKRVFMRILFVQIFLLFGIELFARNNSKYYLLHLLYAAGMVLPIINAMIFHSHFNFAPPAAYKMCAPFFADHTIYGACIAFLVPMLLIVTFSNRTIRLPGALYLAVVLLTILLVTAVVLSFSRAAWISLIIAAFFSFLVVLKVSGKAMLTMVLMAGLGIYSFSDEIYLYISKNDSISNKGDISDHLLSATNVQSDASNTERINRWICAWKIAVENPVKGCGPGMYQFTYGKYQETFRMTRISTFSGNRGHAHSEYFTQLSETGFPGGILFLIIVFTAIGYGMKVIRREHDKRFRLLLYGTVVGLLTFYIHGVFNAFLDSDKMASLVFGSIAIIVVADLRQKRAERGVNSQLSPISEVN